MKNTHIPKLIAIFASIALAAGFATPASADMTTAGYYDQFGVYHVYQTYSGPTTNVGNYGSNYGANSYYPEGYPTYRPYNSNSGYNSRPVTCAAGETYEASGNFCISPARNNTIAIVGDGYNKTSTKSGTVKDDSAQASTVSSIFGRKKTSDKLEISNIVVTSGPKNIYEDKAAVNCDVLVSWTTSVAAAGQVVYGPLSQANAETFDYPSTAPEGNSYKTAHEVKLGCLENVTYAMRIIQNSGGANPQRVVSDEQTIFPIKILTDIPLASGVETTDAPVEKGGASAMSTIGKIITSPIVLVILLGAIGYIVFRALLIRKSKGEGHGVSAHAAEPALQIPHH